MTNSEKTGYKKRPRQAYGPNFDSKTLAPAAVRSTMTASLCTNQIAAPPARVQALLQQPQRVSAQREFCHVKGPAC